MKLVPTVIKDLKSSVLVPLFHFVEKVTIGLVKIDNLVFKWYQQLSRLSFLVISRQYWSQRSQIQCVSHTFSFCGKSYIDNLVFKWYQQLSRCFLSFLVSIGPRELKSNVLVLVGTCGYLWVLVGTCWHVWASVGMCWHLQACVGICGHVWVPVGICWHLWFSLKVKSYRIRLIKGDLNFLPRILTKFHEFFLIFQDIRFLAFSFVKLKGDLHCLVKL